MSPVWMIEGSRKLDPISERKLAERRYVARPQDQALYRRLRQICGEL